MDMKYIYSVLPYYSEDYPIKIRQLVPGEALVFGNFVPMPLLIKVIEANPHPNSDNCIINVAWFWVKIKGGGVVGVTCERLANM